ncbi:MAG: hypothetical protein EHM70_10180 [Chloroflexota bacterium]|nr:MAG: hypothetical protein EHM70_10180 [Chloroflexota bacterium]
MTEFNVRAYYISAQATAPQICWDWIQFLSSEADVIDLLPVRRSIAASSQWQSEVDPDALSAYLDTLEFGNTSLFTPGAETRWLDYTDPWLSEAYISVLAGSDAKAALGIAQQKGTAFLECFYQLDEYADMNAILSCALSVDSNYPQP